MTAWLLGSAGLLAFVLGVSLALGSKYGFAMIPDATAEQRSWVMRLGVALTVAGGVALTRSLFHIL